MKIVNKVLYLAFLIPYLCIGQDIKINQVGFYVEHQKIAIIPTNDNTDFEILRKSDNETVYSGTLSNAKTWTPSNESVKIADFTELQLQGIFYVKSGNLTSYPFKISGAPNEPLFKDLIRAYYFNRASTDIPEQYGGIHKREMGHPDDFVYIHESAASPERPKFDAIESPKGWYDAGDYNKYIVNSGISTNTLLSIYEHYPEFVKSIDLNIPESSNTIPDLLDEIKWNLDWMLSMQDPNDGGVYHKLTTENFSGAVMPSATNTNRFVVMKSTAATLNFSAVMAQAARVFKEYHELLDGYDTICLNAAEYAWEWAQSNPSTQYVQPDDIKTGVYGDNSFSDEFDWAAAELYITTLNDSYYTSTNLISSSINTPGWQDVDGLTWVSLAHHLNDLSDMANQTVIRSRIISHADNILKQYNSSAYKVSIENFYWGSNSLIANEGMMLLQAFKLTSDSTYLKAAQSNLDYILGRNATGYCFVTGNGSKSPMHIHHRQSEADDVDAPVPGFVAGGPNPGQQDDCVYPSTLDALSYSDTWCSYASNEVTINWNAPVAYLAAAMENYYANSEKYPLTTSEIKIKQKIFNYTSGGIELINNSKTKTYEIIDFNGRIIKRGHVSSTLVQLEPGMYILRVQNDKELVSEKIIIQ